MTVQEIRELAKGQIFSAVFIKKNGDVRTMTCRLKVTKHLKGGELAYDAESRGLLPVFDMNKQAYRTINVNTLVSLTINGQSYKF